MKIKKEELIYFSRFKNSFYRELQIDFIFHSNKLEGSTFSEKVLAELIEEGTVVGRHTLQDIYETQNSLEVYQEVINTLGEPLSKELLWNWHYILFKRTFLDTDGLAGRWKKYDNRLANIDLELSSAVLVDQHIFNLIMDWEESNKTLKDIVIFHAKFEKIHPFQDGNGRIGRFIILKQCVENDIDLFAIDSFNKSKYKELLYRAQKYEEYDALEKFFISCSKRLEKKLSKYEDDIKIAKEHLTLVKSKKQRKLKR